MERSISARSERWGSASYSKMTRERFSQVTRWALSFTVSVSWSSRGLTTGR